ncbi:multidrug effflux MFS transporter [Aliiglaciecola sp. LCG003]|uniref:multidrug effflux MFS transporter n=1 Tax=Aliiglaciecola sp. LCG003 TaxID=3053655 RepID=UPI002573E97B|nr:multidrug effflux MFS transporter [Aliiglaciecola sp. LCG003]WJG09564.1 multidrug effflux MFS transporter [Aliiglaciecola sp. LCG003]
MSAAQSPPATILLNYRLISLLAILISTSSLTIGISIPVLPQIAIGLNADLSSATLVVSSYFFGYAIGQIPAGFLADRWGRLPVVYLGCAIFILSGLIGAFSDNLMVLLVMRFIQGLGGAVGPVLSRTIVRDISEGQTTLRLMAILSVVLAISTLIAPLVGSILASFWGWRATLVALPLVILFTAIGLMLTLKETRPRQNQLQHFSQQLILSWKSFYANKQCIWATVIIGCSFGGYASLLGSTGAVLQDIYGFNLEQVGFLIALSIIPYVVATLITRKLTAHYSAKAILGVGMVCFTFAALMFIPMVWFGHAPFVMLWSAIAMYMLGFGFMFPTTTSLILQPLPNTAGFAASMLGTAQTTAGAIVSAIAALLYNQSITPLCFLLGSAGLISAIIYFLTLRRQRPDASVG